MFNTNNAFWRFISRCVDFVGLGLLWAALCLPLITAVPASAALYHTVIKVFYRREEGGFGIFFKSFVGNLKPGILLSFLCVPTIAGCIAGEKMLAAGMKSNGSIGMVAYGAFFLAAIVILGILSFMPPLLGRFNMSPAEIIKTAVYMALKHFISAALVVVMIYFLAIYSLQKWWPIFLTPTLGVFIITLLYERIFQKYANKG